MNIGASGAAASMGVAYGAGAVKSMRTALLICSAGVLLGAVLGGGEVVKTISSGIIPQDILTTKIVVIILLSSTLSLFLANMLGIPLSTSEVTVGAVVGAGVAYQVLIIESLLVIIMFWILVPLAAFLITWLTGKILYLLEMKGYQFKRRWMGAVLVITGFFEAFSAGMNNVANAVGPLVGAGMLSAGKGIWLGGLFVALGVVLLGSRVVETNGKKIVQLTKMEGIVISSTGAILLMISSLYGLPMPLTQVTSSSIIGLGAAKRGRVMLKKKIVSKIIKIWVVSPLISLSMSYFMIKLLIQLDLYSIVVPFSVIIATIGALSLMKIINEEKRSVHEEGGGI
ncbi:inorganic phosphate transporter [Bacillus sp. Marseille-Q1617]|uniref:inorganic phosphate transporter n=1 Tax=Bacillus sp. Marseille-Q1617 TaxID=2736887 RepID=UPI00158D6838|nr:inorganic phosphate transporter [Bacillus sp. Marseille-Q1617]